MMTHAQLDALEAKLQEKEEELKKKSEDSKNSVKDKICAKIGNAELPPRAYEAITNIISESDRAFQSIISDQLSKISALKEKIQNTRDYLNGTLKQKLLQKAIEDAKNKQKKPTNGKQGAHGSAGKTGKDTKGEKSKKRLCD